ncbi:MAG: hypothetical protein M5U28_20410 [Sandaracinaceae bacterium]|nr:hypothetical protein [Sandaracinaceae bacterium]
MWREQAGSGQSVAQLMEQRDLSEDDVRAALRTYTPSGRRDEFIMFASGATAAT